MSYSPINSTSGSTQIGDTNTYSNFTPTAATVKGALSGIDSALSGAGGSVSSVALADSTNLFNITGSPITHTGTLTLASFKSQTANTFFAAPNGSSAAPTFRLIVAADVPTLNQNTTGTAANVTGTSNSTLTTLSALTTASSLASIGTINSGTWGGTTIAIAHGGTGNVTASSAFSALSPITTTGDLIYSSSGTTNSRLAIGSNGQVLTVSSGLPSWQTATVGANTALSNLSGVAINTSLLPGADNTINLGSLSQSWATANIHFLVDGSAETSVDVYNRLLEDTGANVAVDYGNRLLKDTAAAIQLSWSTSGVELNQLTASTVPYLNSSKVLTSSAVTPTQLSFVDATSSIQTQLNSKQASGNYITALTGDGSASGPGSAAFTLATVNSNVGSFGSSTSIPSFTVNAKGLITAASGNVVVAPAGTLSGTTLNSTVVTSSLTTVGTIGTGTWNGTAIGPTFGGTGLTSYVTGDTLYASAANTLSKLSIGSTGNVLTVSGGIPVWAPPATGGTVTSVALSDGSTTPIFNITGSPVTNSGTLTFTLKTESANTIFAGPTTGSAAQPGFRSLVGADLPNPSASTLGGIQSIAAVSHQWINSISTSGVPSLSQPAFTDISGTLAGSQLPTFTGDVTNSSAVTTVAQIQGTVVSGTTGTTNVVFSSGPTLSNPVVGTQSQSDSSTKAASTAYVTTAIANAISGVNPAVAVQAATTSASDTSSYTYNNGASGVGATLTGPTNTALTVDGFTFSALGQRLLVKNDTQSPSGAFNGIYYVTQLQTGLLPLILTRALDYDQPSDINNTGAIPVINGTVNGTTTWVETSTINTVGTDPLVFTLFTRNPANYLLVANNLSDVASKSTSFNNISPITTTGDLIYSSSGTTNSRLAIGSTGNVLTVSGGVPSWAAPATNGTITSVAMTVPSFLSVSGSPITTSGTLAVTLSGTALPIANGGTGQTTASSAFNALSPMTTAGDMIYGGASGAGTRLANGSSGQVLTSNGGTAAPSWSAVPTPTYKAPTVQKFTSSSGTYTTPTSPAPLYIEIYAVGGGGGGGGGGAGGSSTAGSSGSATTFGTSLISAGGGGGGGASGGSGTGGTASLGSGPIGVAIAGTAGLGAGEYVNTTSGGFAGGGGGNSPYFSGGGAGSIAAVGGTAVANTGGGGAGGGSANASSGNDGSGGGGGSGGFVNAIISSPASSYNVTIGVGGTHGNAGTNGSNGGDGAAGQIIVWEYYQ